MTTKMPFSVLAALCATISMHAVAQVEPRVRSTESLAMLDGVWSGPAWVIAPDGRRYEMQQTETVCPAIFGQIRVMEGRGQASGQTRFHAITIFEGQSDGTITMRSYTPGRSGQYPLTLRDHGFEWSHEMNGQFVRYAIRIDDGVWYETGERRSADGSTWEPIFGMELVRQDMAEAACITPLDKGGPAQ